MGLELIFFDMEGTLISKRAGGGNNGTDYAEHSLWARLMTALGPQALDRDRETVRKWLAGGYANYTQWCHETLEILRDNGLTQAVFEKTMAGDSFNPGVAKTISAINARGIKTAIVSGGFMAQARLAQHRLRINHSFAAVDLFWDASGALDHWNIFPSDYRGKVEFLHLLRREYGLPKEACGFVGDGGNDVYIAQEVGTSFAFQAEPELRAVATHAIDSFEEILSHLD